jgi:hypothetical protein
MGRQELGAAFLPVHEARLMKLSPADGETYLAGLRDMKPKSAEPMKREGDLRPGNNDDGPILAPGEDATKVHPTILDMRAQQAAQYGRETVVASLAGKRVN